MGEKLVRGKMMKIVTMTNAHVEQVAALDAACFSVPWSLQSITAELSNPLALWLVAVLDGKVVGYIGSQTVLDEADMMNLAVVAEYRGRGVGRLLAEALITALRDNGVRCITLEVRDSNEAAVGLYSSLGFTEIARRPNYYIKPKEDARILRKELLG